MGKRLISLFAVWCGAAYAQSPGTIEVDGSSIVATVGTLVCAAGHSPDRVGYLVRVGCTDAGAEAWPDTVYRVSGNSVQGSVRRGSDSITWLVTAGGVAGDRWQFAANEKFKSGGLRSEVMSIALVSRLMQGLGANGGTSASIDTSGANFLCGCIVSYSLAAAPTFSDSKGNTWSSLTAYTQGSRVRIQMFYSTNPSVGTSHTFTASAVSSSFSAIGAAAFSGMLTSSPFQAGTDLGAGSFAATQQPGSATSGVSPALVITCTATDTSANVSSIDLSFDKQSVNFLGSNYFGGGMAYLIQTSAAAVNPTWAYAGTDDVVADIAAFGGSSVSGKLFLPPNLALGAGGPFFRNPLE